MINLTQGDVLVVVLAVGESAVLPVDAVAIADIIGSVGAASQ